ncbi:hypothetical protein RDI58_003656 [Solanum bulbocastanum]|uniref:Uncharacterized protein n=1 Tax=Solanum bulbocastanum TaxID=147425 RepID=A0AAN8UHX1_SOLBU
MAPNFKTRQINQRKIAKSAAKALLVFF